jgi:16S rRNA (uracil1498-N3)-methyltransferase
LTSDHFFVPRERLTEGRAVLRGSEHHHLARVLRARTGDQVWLFDEDGCRYRAKIDRLTGEEGVLTILETISPPDVATKIVLAPALLKAKPMDDLILQAAELGVFRISPVISERTVSRIEGPSERKLERWSRIARTSSKQSRSGRIPIIEPPVALPVFLAACRADRKYVLTEHGGARFKDLRAASSVPPAEAAVLIGPEGGWSEIEEDFFVPAGFIRMSLGRTILRAETAALAGVTLLAQEWNG